MPRFHNTPNGKVQFTTAEETAADAQAAAWASDSKNRKLSNIRRKRDDRLKRTDWMAVSDYTMPDYIKTWRQSLRDLPQDNTTESKYDELLEQDDNGKLKHSIWKQPTS